MTFSTGKVRVTSEVYDRGVKLLKDQKSFGLGFNNFLKHACSYSFSWKKVDGNYKGNDMNEV
jgi:hypothetical protein